MSIPCNPTDFERFQKLSQLLAAKNPPVEMSIYCGTEKGANDQWVSLEIKGNLSREDVNYAFGIVQVETVEAAS